MTSALPPLLALLVTFTLAGCSIYNQRSCELIRC